MEFQAFINREIAARPIEADIVRRVIAALAEAGTPVVNVWDGVESTPVVTERDIMEQVFNLDEAYLYTTSGAWVRLVMGNEWDLIADYLISLEEALDPVQKYIAQNW